MEEKKMLLIVDCQNSFINGEMAVEGAEEKMIALAKYIRKNKYDIIIMTADWHPVNHSSFKMWPPHCIQHTVGAAIYPEVFNAATETCNNVRVLTKGDVSSKEEYSLMDNYLSSKSFMRYVDSNNIKTIDVCGLVNEYCVLSTVKDLTEKYNQGDKLCILVDYVAAIKDENVLLNYIDEKGLKYQYELKH